MTEIKPATDYYLAAEFHQQYLAKQRQKTASRQTSTE